MTTEERLDVLERELARLKFRNRWLVAVVVLSILGLGLASTWTLTTASAQDRLAGLSPKILRGTELVLEDEDGKHTATLRASQDGVHLALGDENRLIRASLEMDLREGPSLKLRDKDGKIRAILGVHQTVNPDGTQSRHAESSMRLLDPNGKTLWSAP